MKRRKRLRRLPCWISYSRIIANETNVTSHQSALLSTSAKACEKFMGSASLQSRLFRAAEPNAMADSPFQMLRGSTLDVPGLPKGGVEPLDEHGAGPTLGGADSDGGLPAPGVYRPAPFFDSASPPGFGTFASRTGTDRLASGDMFQFPPMDMPDLFLPETSLFSAEESSFMQNFFDSLLQGGPVPEPPLSFAHPQAPAPPSLQASGAASPASIAVATPDPLHGLMAPRPESADQLRKLVIDGQHFVLVPEPVMNEAERLPRFTAQQEQQIFLLQQQISAVANGQPVTFNALPHAPGPNEPPYHVASIPTQQSQRTLPVPPRLPLRQSLVVEPSKPTTAPKDETAPRASHRQISPAVAESMPPEPHFEIEEEPVAHHGRGAKRKRPAEGTQEPGPAKRTPAARKSRKKQDMENGDETVGVASELLEEAARPQGRGSAKRGAKATSIKREPLTEEQKRQNHILSEQRRRNAIRDGFANLCASVPSLRGQGGTGAGSSKGVILFKAVEYLQKLQAKVERLEEEEERLAFLCAQGATDHLSADGHFAGTQNGHGFVRNGEPPGAANGMMGAAALLDEEFGGLAPESLGIGPLLQAASAASLPDNASVALVPDGLHLHQPVPQRTLKQRQTQEAVVLVQQQQQQQPTNKEKAREAAARALLAAQFKGPVEAGLVETEGLEAEVEA